MTLANRISDIRNRMQQAAISCGRNPSDIRLVAVSKTKPVEMLEAAIAAGATDLGENYIQEAREKIDIIGVQAATWHFIGHLQSNKARHAVNRFDLIHSVDSVKLAAAIDREAEKIGKIQPILLQVNTGNETAKFGVSPQDVAQLAQAVSGLPHVRVKGLMAIPPYDAEPDRVRPHFRALRRLRDAIASLHLPGCDPTELSMGMTGDFEVAIEEGATLIRVGTAIFGVRS